MFSYILTDIWTDSLIITAWRRIFDCSQVKHPDLFLRYTTNGVEGNILSSPPCSLFSCSGRASCQIKYSLHFEHMMDHILSKSVCLLFHPPATNPTGEPILCEDDIPCRSCSCLSRESIKKGRQNRCFIVSV